MPGVREPRELFDYLKTLITEQSNPKTIGIDTASVAEILRLINAEDSLVHRAVSGELDAVERGVTIIVDAFKAGGRLFYLGAGTSGRLGVLDASECPPTFGTHPDQVQGIVAGGADALVRAVEGAEDDGGQSIEDLTARSFCSRDVLCGISASKRTPYVVTALEHALRMGAKTIYVTCTPRSELDVTADVAICPVVGPEVIMGSTRMKAGTATKLVLNMLTTASFIRMGKVYRNMMVDLRMTSNKLRERSKRVVMMVTGVDYSSAEKVLQNAGGHVKTAIVMILGDVSRERAVESLEQGEGFVRRALDILGVSEPEAPSGS